jgi:hypothetical protein
MTDQPTATTDAEEDLRGTTCGATLPEAQRDLVVVLGTLTDLHARWRAEINKWEEEVRQWERRWNDPLLLLRRAYALLNERDVVHDASRSAGETLPVVSRDATPAGETPPA